MARRRKKDDGGGGGGSNWMDTYGDMVTLLLTFFILLFSFSTIDAKKWEIIVQSFTGSGTSILSAMNIEQVVQAPISLEINSQTEEKKTPDEGSVDQDLENFYRLVANLKDFIEENEISAELYPEPDTFTVTLRFQDNILFDSGDASIKTEGKPIIANLAEVIVMNSDIIDTITIEGHTDTDPINTALYVDNWDLSSKRANNTVRELQLNAEINPVILRPLGLGEHHPVSDNDSTAGKAQNRRVDFVIKSVVTSA